MAGDGHCYGVGGASSSHCSCGFRHAYLFCHGAVGAGFSARNSLQSFPDSTLERGRPDVQRERGIGFLSLNEAREILSPLGHGRIVATADGEGKLADQALYELLIGITELNGADALVGGGDQHASQGRSAAALWPPSS